MSTNKRYQEKARQVAKQRLEEVTKILKEEYAKPLSERVVLSHHLLRERLGMNSSVAWEALKIASKHRVCCAQLPSGHIFWDDAEISIGEMIRRKLHVRTSR